MSSSLGIHLYRNELVLPPNMTAVAFDQMLINIYPYHPYGDPPEWIIQTGNHYDSYRHRTISAFKYTSWHPPGVQQNSNNRVFTFGDIVIFQVPEDAEYGINNYFYGPVFNNAFHRSGFAASIPEPSIQPPYPGWVLSIDHVFYEFRSYVGTTPLTAEFFVNKRPNYESLISGYSQDSRTVPNLPTISIPTTETARISYYRGNRLEPIPDLQSICWIVKDVQIIANIPIQLPIVDSLLGTLYCDNAIVSNAIKALPTNSGCYRWNDLFPENISSLFIEWKTLADPAYQLASDNYRSLYRIRKLAANNDAWSNTDLSNNLDIGYEIDHPMFAINNTRAYNWHLSAQTEGIGSLVMDSPRTIETNLWMQELRKALQAQNYQSEDLTADPPVHYLDWYIKNGSGEKIDKIYSALDAGKWGVNPDDPNIPRVDNLGWRIQRGNEVWGIRVKHDGTIDEALEKTTNRRLHVSGSVENDIQKYNPNCFGSEGMLIRHLPNKFSTAGLRSGGYRKVKDIPQLLAELHEQANAAMGYQEGTAIEIQVDGQTYRYPNQLALMTELFVTAKQTATYSKGAFFSSLIGEQSIKEVMAGLGLRTVDKYLEFDVAGRTAKLYYKGISASQSIRRKMSALATNIGITIGNII
jgi:hypothetical protein